MMPGLSVSTYPSPGNLSWPAAQYQPALPGGPMFSRELHFFVSRDDGSLVPLVPIDELPNEVRLIGVPQKLNHGQAKEMTFVGHLPFPGKRFNCDTTTPTSESSTFNSNVLRYNPQSKVVPCNDCPPQVITFDSPSSPTPSSASTLKPITASQPTSDLRPASDSLPTPPQEPKSSKTKPLYNERPLPPSGVEPDQKKKIYCTFWIQNGSCSFAQQGCLYKHEMPDRTTLKSIGIYRVPTWWEKQERKQRSLRLARANAVRSEREEIERRQTSDSALHKDNPLRVRISPAGSSRPQAPKQPAPNHRPEPTTKKAANTVAAATLSTPPTSPQGGVQLGAAKTPIRGPSAFPRKKTALEGPIEENLIDFEVLVPSSASDSSATQASSVSPGDHRGNSAVRRRRGSKDHKVETAGPSRRAGGKNKAKTQSQQDGSSSGETEEHKVKHSAGASKKGKGKAALVEIKQGKAPVAGESDTQADDTA